MCHVIEPSAYVERVRRARKVHWCCECQSDIAVGDEYVYSSGVWNGRGNSHKTCRRCADVRAKLSDAARGVDACGAAFGGLAERLSEMFGIDGTYAEVIAAGAVKLGIVDKSTIDRQTTA